MANIPQITFNAGKLTPLADARSDIEKYAFGCRILDDMIPRIYGPVERRPGTKYLADVADHDIKSRMVSFIFSSEIAYKLEFGDQIINVYFGDDLVDTVTSPYLEDDLFQLQFGQSADVMWIGHPSYAQRKFSRVSATEFTLEEIVFDKGPFIERNDIAENDGVTIAVTGTAIATATAGAAESGTFTITSTTNISSRFPENKRFYVTGSTGNDGPYTVFSSSYASPTLTITANEVVPDDTDDGRILVDDQSVILTASAPTFESDHVGSLFKLTHKRLQTVTKGNATGTGIIGQAIDVKGGWTFNTTGHWAQTVEVQRNEDGTNWETFRTYVSTITNGVGSRNVQKSDVEEANGVLYRINVTAVDSPAGTLTADFTVDKSTQDSIYRITAFTSANSVTATAVVSAPDNVATKRWAEGSWSGVRGYPSAFTFFGERSVYGFTNSDQQNIWLSEVGEFEDFEAGIKDADSFALRIPTANRGRWLGSLETLAAGTTGGEWQIRTTTLEQALTPTNFDMKQQTRWGSADIQVLEVNDAILFIDKVARRIREYTFSDPKQKYVSPDLTALAEDIFSGGVTSAAVQTRPDSIIWFTIANSPYLVSMTYEREQNVVAFANHPLGGAGIAESVIVTPSTSEDIITLTAKRTIGSNTRRFIEEMQPRDWGSKTNATNSFFVDAGIVDTNGSITVSNLGHLEGETVAVLVDGAVQARKVVSGDQITLDEAGGRAVVGLPYTYRVSPMRKDIATREGTTLGSKTKTTEIVLSLFASGNVSFGDGTNQKPIDFRTTEPYDSPPQLFTGLTENLAFDGGYTRENDIVVSGSDPLPCTVRAIVARTEKTGR